MCFFMHSGGGEGFSFVGLDAHKVIVDNLYENTDDFAHDTLVLPNFVQKLITDGNPGRKSSSGLY